MTVRAPRRSKLPTDSPDACCVPPASAGRATAFEESQPDLTFISAMPRFSILSLTLFCLFVFGGRATLAANGDREARRAESVVLKLRLLDDAAASGDADAYRKLAGKLFPGLFVSASELHDGDLKTDLSTAAVFYESAPRARGRATDCERELRETYFRLCRENAGDRAALLVAKARLHERWAEAELNYLRGARDDSTLDALAQVRAERSTDLSLAAEALRALEELAEKTDAAQFGGRLDSSTERELSPDESAKRLAEKFSDPLEEVDRILASPARRGLPRPQQRARRFPRRTLLASQDASRKRARRQRQLARRPKPAPTNRPRPGRSRTRRRR